MNEIIVSKVKSNGVIAATVKYNNDVDSERVYDIHAEVKFLNGSVTNIDSGEVIRIADSVAVASFAWWEGDNVSSTIQGNDDNERGIIFSAIIDFVNNIIKQASSRQDVIFD